MKIPLTILAISHRHGLDATAHPSREAAEAKLDEFCKEWWHELGGAHEMPDEREARRETYFGARPDEGADLYETEAFIESPLETLAREALDYERQAFEQDEPVSGADLVDWFCEWRTRLAETLAAG